jgi:hypothetical protein
MSICSPIRAFVFRRQLADKFFFIDEKRVTRGWLACEIERRATSPGGRLLAIFDVFDGWFRKKFPSKAARSLMFCWNQNPTAAGFEPCPC